MKTFIGIMSLALLCSSAMAQNPMFKSQYHADTAEAKAEVRSSFREARWMILLVVLAMGIYLGWYRRT